MGQLLPEPVVRLGVTPPMPAVPALAVPGIVPGASKRVPVAVMRSFAFIGCSPIAVMLGMSPTISRALTPVIGDATGGVTTTPHAAYSITITKAADGTVHFTVSH